jgi:hypothetical protein
MDVLSLSIAEAAVSKYIRVGEQHVEEGFCGYDEEGQGRIGILAKPIGGSACARRWLANIIGN